jgi:diadenosine tetraphosphate (Ap4A) HIT family hydrolase
VFCEIVAGREEASAAYEDEHVVAIMDLNPVNPGHLFVIPRVHVVHLHVVPRTHGDSFRIEADWRQRDRTELNTAAEQVRQGLRAL